MKRTLPTALVLISCALSACVYGPKTERKSTLSALNGENYETSPQGPTTVVVPFIKAKERETRLSGMVVTSKEELEIPLRFVAVGVFSKEGQTLAQATTDSDGKFMITAPLHNGEYSLRVISPKYSGERPLAIDSYEMKNLTVRTTPKASR